MGGRDDQKKFVWSRFLKKCALTALILSMILIATYFSIRLYCLYGELDLPKHHKYLLDGGVIVLFTAPMLYLASLAASVWGR